MAGWNYTRKYFACEIGDKVQLKSGADKWTIRTYDVCDAISGHRALWLQHDGSGVELKVNSAQLKQPRRKPYKRRKP